MVVLEVFKVWTMEGGKGILLIIKLYRYDIKNKLDAIIKDSAQILIPIYTNSKLSS